MVYRRAARLLVVDTGGCVLLFQYESEGERWWATPGGGLEEAETFEAAAAREAAEELALSDIQLVPLWDETVDVALKGRRIRQHERYFLARLAREALMLDHRCHEERRREGIVATRWWCAEELRLSRERVYPEDLGERLAGLPR